MSIDSDDDRSGKHHWSRQQTEEAFVGLDPLICSEDNTLGSPSMRFIDHATPAHLLGLIFNDNFVLKLPGNMDTMIPNFVNNFHF